VLQTATLVCRKTILNNDGSILACARYWVSPIVLHQTSVLGF
jgi:hypothetical protein